MFFSTGFKIILFLILFSSPLWGDPAKIQETGKKTIGVYQDIQSMEDKWENDKGNLENRYSGLKQEIESITKKRDRLQNRINSLKKARSEAEREISETARIAEDLQEYLDSIIEQVESDLNRNIPFLYKERSRRIQEVKSSISDPDTNLAEKCRRVMETLKIETDYGNSTEVYQDIISVEELGQNDVSADILRIGSASLFWRSPDGKNTGIWNHAEKKWKTLPSKHNRNINQAIEMVLKQRPVELTKLPIGRLIKR